jgi:RNA-directed DNA polymerase
MLVRRTMRTRLTGKIREVTLEMRRRMHQPIAQQGRWLQAVVRGHYAYYGVPTNVHALGAFRKVIAMAWYKSLRRRSQRRRLNWRRMHHLATRWIPAARIVHPWPNQRFAARPKIRAQCGSSARWALYGGRFESS